jgi:hypothetical protein
MKENLIYSLFLSYKVILKVRANLNKTTEILLSENLTNINHMEIVKLFIKMGTFMMV